MSRTYKDKPWKYKNPEAYSWTWGTELVPYEYTYSHWKTGEMVTTTRFWHKQLPGVKTKKKKHIHTDWDWVQSTPSWWTRMMMNRPTRREVHLLEHEASHLDPGDLEEFDIPDKKRKPHIYYW